MSRSDSNSKRRSISRSPKRDRHDRSDARPHRDYHDYDLPDDQYRRDYERRSSGSKHKERHHLSHDRDRGSRESPRSHHEEKGYSRDSRRDYDRKDSSRRHEEEGHRKMANKSFQEKEATDYNIDESSRDHGNVINEKDMELIKARYIGKREEKKPRKNLRPGEKKFVFDWDPSEDTSSGADSLLKPSSGYGPHQTSAEIAQKRRTSGDLRYTE